MIISNTSTIQHIFHNVQHGPSSQTSNLPCHSIAVHNTHSSSDDCSYQARTAMPNTISPHSDSPPRCFRAFLPSTLSLRNFTPSASRSQNGIWAFLEPTPKPPLSSTERGSPPYSQLPTLELTARFINNMPTFPSVVPRASRIERDASLPHSIPQLQVGQLGCTSLYTPLPRARTQNLPLSR